MWWLILASLASAGVRRADSDGDGLSNNVDACPEDPEDFDGFEDQDGCPEPDNDRDGILDADDRCPHDPEDADGFEDADGCPEADNDRDGIFDAMDACPNEPGTRDGAGCPGGASAPTPAPAAAPLPVVLVDTDRDGVDDPDDRCVAEPGPDRGCPSPGKAFRAGPAPLALAKAGAGSVKWPSVDSPVAGRSPAGPVRALVVGVAQDGTFPVAAKAHEDATAVAATLRTTAGVGPTEIRHLDNLVNIDLIGRVTANAQAVGQSGLQWVYWAGQCGAVPVSGCAGAECAVEPALLAGGASGPVAIPVRELVAAAATGGARAVVALDCAFSGADRLGVRTDPSRPLQTPGLPEIPASVSLWTAAGNGPLAGLHREAPHGLFTYAFLGGLRGWADGEGGGSRDGAVSAGELRAFVERVVKKNGQRQIPVCLGDCDRPLLVSGVSDKAPAL